MRTMNDRRFHRASEQLETVRVEPGEALDDL